MLKLNYMSLERKLFKERVESKPEIERKFILTNKDFGTLDLKDSKHTEIIQGWYRPAKNEKKLRLRKEVDLKTGEVKYTRTLKERTSQDMLERDESEEVISEEEFLKFFGECKDFIVKERYYYEDKDAGMLEIDVFRNRDLIIVEKESKTREDAKKFQPLPWFGKEVTRDPKYTNKNMSKERRGAR